jgi:hypothetical protein
MTENVNAPGRSKQMLHLYLQLLNLLLLDRHYLLLLDRHRFRAEEVAFKLGSNNNSRPAAILFWLVNTNSNTTSYNMWRACVDRDR